MAHAVSRVRRTSPPAEPPPLTPPPPPVEEEEEGEREKGGAGTRSSDGTSRSQMTVSIRDISAPLRGARIVANDVVAARVPPPPASPAPLAEEPPRSTRANASFCEATKSTTRRPPRKSRQFAAFGGTRRTMGLSEALNVRSSAVPPPPSHI